MNMNGWKSYLIAAAVAALTYARAQNYITPEQYTTLIGLLGAGGLASLRHAIATEVAKLNAKVPPAPKPPTA